MLSLFGSKKSGGNTRTVVHPDVGALLVRQKEFPAGESSPAAMNGGHCSRTAIRGRPPAAKFVPNPVDGETTTAYVVTDIQGQPPLAVVDIREMPFNFEIWSLDDSTTHGFASRRELQIDPEQKKWVGIGTAGVACLPERQLLIALRYEAPDPQNALYRYDIAGNNFARIASIESNVRDLDQYFQTLPAGGDAVLALYYTDKLRLAPEVYTNLRNHVLLYSKRYPKGIEILDLGNDDGSIVHWKMVDRTLWLDTLDWRKQHEPIRYVWSLDLSKLI